MGIGVVGTRLDFLFFWGRFATKERDGLLLYNGRFNERHDFVALEIVQEQVQLTFSAGMIALQYICQFILVYKHSTLGFTFCTLFFPKSLAIFFTSFAQHAITLVPSLLLRIFVKWWGNYSFSPQILFLKPERCFIFPSGETTSTVAPFIPGGVSDGQWHTVHLHYYNKVRLFCAELHQA